MAECPSPQLKQDRSTTLKESPDCDSGSLETVSDKSLVCCDFCSGVKQNAIKSCLDCGVHLCSSHLDIHNNAQKFKKHKLINVVENLEKYICQIHEKPLELFCRAEQKCVCQFCTERDHKNHIVISLLEERDQKKSQLEKRQTGLQQMIHERLEKIQEINHSVELSKINTEKEKSNSVDAFAALIHSIERSQAELLEVMEEKQNAAEKQAKELVKQLEQEIEEIKSRDFDLEQLLHTEDHLHFLEIYPSLCCNLHTRNWTEIKICIDFNMDVLRTTLPQLQKSLNDKITTILNEKLKEAELMTIQQYAVHVTLDPETSSPHLVLADDGKQVTYEQTKQNFPDSPKRFTNYPIVLGKQGFSSVRFYYEVEVSGKTMWDLGVVKESVNRKDRLKILNPQNGFWAVALRNGDDYTACDSSSVSLSLRKKPQKVGVFVDYEEGLVAFYDVEIRSHIYSFTGQSFTDTLYPYFSPGLNDRGKNLAPLIISHISNIKYSSAL